MKIFSGIDDMKKNVVLNAECFLFAWNYLKGF